MANQENNLGGQYLSFQLDGETFALEIAKVREVLEFVGVTRVPRSPDFMRGVINLRGAVVPVIDLKSRFGVGRTERETDTCVIIVELLVEEEATVVGVLADSVQEVFDLESEEIQPPPSVGSWINTDFVRGMGKRDDNFLMLLDLDRVFSTGEMDSALAAVEAA